MKILAIEKERVGSDPSQMKTILRSEAAKVWELYQKDMIREAYFEKDLHLAVLVLECAGLADPQELVQSLPLVQAGFIDFTLLPLIPYDGYARLFNPSP